MVLSQSIMVSSCCSAISGIRNGGRVNVWPHVATFLVLNGMSSTLEGTLQGRKRDRERQGVETNNVCVVKVLKKHQSCYHMASQQMRPLLIQLG